MRCGLGHEPEQQSSTGSRVRHWHELCSAIISYLPGVPGGTTTGMQANRTATVLFAEPSSGTKRSEACRNALARAVVSVTASSPPSAKKPLENPAHPLAGGNAALLRRARLGRSSRAGGS